MRAMRRAHSLERAGAFFSCSCAHSSGEGIRLLLCPVVLAITSLHSSLWVIVRANVHGRLRGSHVQARAWTWTITDR
jgi:hypothetical protein